MYVSTICLSFLFFADKKFFSTKSVCLLAHMTILLITTVRGGMVHSDVVSVTKLPKSWEDLSEMPRLFITEPWQQFHFIYS